MIPKARLRELYCGRRLSMMQIAAELRTTHATVLYWMKRHKISRRTWSESTYVKLNPHGHPFKIPAKLSARQQELMVAGLLLYWAEGSKTQGHLQLANLDHRMLQLFVKFLREVCHINEQRLRVYVRVHKRFSLNASRRYWSRALSLSLSRVFVYPHTDVRSKEHKQWSRYGIATLNVNSTTLKQWLDNAIEEYIGKQLGKSARGNVAYPTRSERVKFFVRDEEPDFTAWRLPVSNGDAGATDGSMSPITSRNFGLMLMRRLLH